jgi:tetratricopeptide (TPR) repeat protein
MRKKEILFLLILMVVFFSIYWKTIDYDLIYDSKNLFANNPIYTGSYSLIAAFKFGFLEQVGLSMDKGAYYRPLTTFSFLMDKFLWGLHPRILRIINLFIFSLALIALFYFFKIQTFKFPVPLLLTALFALHPLQVDNIVWIVGRSDLLLLLWGVLTLLFLELYCQKQRQLFIILSLLCYALGIFSKESMLFFLPVLLVYEKIRTRRISFQFHLVILIISVSFLVLKFLVVGVFSLPTFFRQDPVHYFLLSLTTIGYYLKSVLLPYSGSPFLPPGHTINGEHIVWGIVFILLFGLLLFFSRKKTTLLIPLSLVFVFLLGHLSLVFTSLYPFRASSRYLVFPLLGFLWLAGYLINRMSSFRRYAVIAVLLVSYVPFIFINQTRYTDELSFWQRLHSEYPTQGYFAVKTAEFLANQKEYLPAENVLAGMLESKLDLPAAINMALLRARIEFVKARYPESEEWLQRMNRFSLYPVAGLRKGRRKAMILVSTGEIKKAEEEIKSLVKKFNSRELMVLQYEMYLGQLNWIKAAELGNKIQKRFPGLLSKSPAESKHRFEISPPVEKFRFYIAYKNYSKALGILQTFPENEKRDMLQAKILYWQGQEEKAKEVINSILKNHPDDHSVLNRVGNFYLREMFRLKEGLYYFNESLKIKAFQPEITQLIHFFNTNYQSLL